MSNSTRAPSRRTRFWGATSVGTRAPSRRTTNAEHGTIDTNDGTVNTNDGTIGVLWSNSCICKEQWSIDDYENCGVTQNGCEPTACDGDTAPWCNIKNPGCDDEVDGGGWAYCTTDSASSGSLQ